jgi:hypothetical protein
VDLVRYSSESLADAYIRWAADHELTAPPVIASHRQEQHVAWSWSVSLLLGTWARHLSRRRDFAIKFLALCLCTMCTCLVWSNEARDPIVVVYEISQFFFWILGVTVISAHANVGYWMDMYSQFQFDLPRKNVHPISFCLAQTLSSTIESLLSCLFFGFVTFQVLFPDKTWGQCAYFVMFLTCHALAHGAIVEAFVVATQDQARTHVCAMLMAAFAFPFSGAIVPVKEMFPAISWLSHLSYTFYARSALMALLYPESEYVDELVQPIHRPLVNWIFATLGFWLLCRCIYLIVFWVVLRRQYVKRGTW